MILTCPSCTMRYLVAEGAVGPDGRKVRCANCGHEWWQEGEEGLDEALFDRPGFTEDAEPEPEENHEKVYVDVPEEEQAASFNSILQKEIDHVAIPEGVKPDHGDLPLAIPDSAAKRSGQRMAGFITALFFYVGLTAVFLLMHEQISRAWPPSNLVYNLVGLKPVPPGEGLTLSDLEAKIGDGRIVMTGDIINLKDEDVKVPAILASVVRDDEEVIDRVLIAPPVSKLKGQDRVSFDVVYPSVPDGAANVNFAFTFLKADEPKEEKPAQETAAQEEETSAAEEPNH